MCCIFDIVIFMDERLPHQRSNSFPPLSSSIFGVILKRFFFYWQSFAQKLNYKLKTHFQLFFSLEKFRQKAKLKMKNSTKK